MTIIADNYFGYCKKEVKTQISFSANLLGCAEEEHAGGAIARPSYDLGEAVDGSIFAGGYLYEDAMKLIESDIIRQPEGQCNDKNFKNVVYIPESSVFNVEDSSITFKIGKEIRKIMIQKNVNYVLPSGYVIKLERTLTSRKWTLRGILPHHTLCHKPCTVSGGGKSEISKSISDAIIEGKMFIHNKEEDFKLIETVLQHDYSKIYRDGTIDNIKLLDMKRTLGSVIKVLTPSPIFTDAHNKFVEGIPRNILEIVFVIKSLYRVEWKGDWQSRITVDLVNGHLGNEIKYRTQPLPSNNLRIGFAEDKMTWRVFQLRKDFFPSQKLQMEDDISASVVIPSKLLPGFDGGRKSYKFVRNCETHMFQRPDDAIFRGFDKQTESDFASPGNFIVNFHGMERPEAQAVVKDIVRLYQYTEPMRHLLTDFANDPQQKYKYVVSTSQARWVDSADEHGKKVPSNNPRYLQRRPDMMIPWNKYLTYKVIQLHRKLSNEQPLFVPIDSILSGRRCNPVEINKKGFRLRALAVFSAIHYYEYPELMIEYITSMTGASPSTYGAGSEGALTKGPFNCLPGIIDLNNILIAMILCGYQGFVTAAAYCGPKYKISHDVSMLIPEIWSRMRPSEQCPKYLLEHGFLEAVPDVSYKGKVYPGKRLGYRITEAFCLEFLGRIFTAPNTVLPTEFLKPELQSLELYADSYEFISITDSHVCNNYIKDGTIEGAIPPLKKLILIMANGGEHEGVTLDSPEFRNMFTEEYVLSSQWYKDRLDLKQKQEIAYYYTQIANLKKYMEKNPKSLSDELPKRLEEMVKFVKYVDSSQYRDDLIGTIGCDVFMQKFMPK